MTTTPPGWYDDGRGAKRWWDGANWTEHVAAPLPAEPLVGEVAPSTEPPAAPRESTGPPAVAPPFSDQTVVGAASPVGSSGYQAYAPAEPNGWTAPPAEPRKSRMWILWVALGIIVIGILVTVAVVAPILVGLAGRAGPAAVPTPETSTATPSAEATTVPQENVVPTDADKEAATAAVVRHNEAWLTGDCDGYMATTTEALREVSQITSCDSFAVESRNFAISVDDYVTQVAAVDTIGDSINVSTAETYTSLYDADGNPTPDRVAYEDRYRYVLVLDDGQWLINNYYLE